MINDLTPLILTYNEAQNIGRVLERLAWAHRVIVIDSYSSDETLAIVRSYPNVKVYQRVFDNHAAQWNYGLEQITSHWVLSLDADYILTDDLIKEMMALEGGIGIDGYFVKFKYCISGKPLRGTILPPRQVLFRRDKGIYKEDGHTQVLYLSGRSAFLSSFIYHDDRKSLSRWLSTQDNYAVLEAQKLVNTPSENLCYNDRIRKKKIFAPILVFIFCLIVKGTLFDGWRGFYYSLQRTLAEILLSIRLIEVEKLNRHDQVEWRQK